MNLKSKVVLLVIIYITISFNEWFIHKYIMHNTWLYQNKLDRHIDHHKDVKSDMSVTSDDGMSFRFVDSCIPLVACLSICIKIATRASGIDMKNKHILPMCIMIIFIYKTLWDYLHFKIHKREPYNKIYEYILPKTYIDWVCKNHTMHHKIKGKQKGNYNIILPLFDHIMGTYNY